MGLQAKRALKGAGRLLWAGGAPALSTLLLAVALSAAFALGVLDDQPALILTDEQSSYSLGQAFYVLEDPTGDLTVEDVTSSAYAGRFALPQGRQALPPYSDSAYWVRIRLDNRSEENEDWRLELATATPDEVSFYQPMAGGDGYRTHQTGSAFPVWTRDLPTPGFAFQLNLEPGQTQDFYLRLRTLDSLSLPLALMSVDAFVMHRATLDVLWGLSFGVFAFMGAYFAVQYLQLRERSYLALALAALSALVYFVFMTGYGDRYLLQNTPLLYRILAPIALAMGTVAVAILADVMLEAAHRAPRLHTLLQVLGILTLLALALMLAPNRLALSAVQFGLLAATLLVIVVVCLVVVRQGYPLASAFLRAILAPALFISLAALASLVLADGFWPTLLPLAFLAVIELLLLSWVVGQRMKMVHAEAEAANEALVWERQRYQLILDDQLDLIARLSPDGAITFVNRACYEFFGRDDVPLVGANVNDIIPDEAAALVNETMQKAGRAEPIHTVEVILIRGDGRPRWTRWQIRALYAEDDQVVEFQASGEDITEERQNALELARYRDHLEEVVDERTRELRQQRAIARSLERTAAILNSSLDFTVVSQAILYQVGQVRECDGTALMLRDGDHLAAMAASGVSRFLLGGRYEIGDLSTPSMRAFMSGVPVIMDDTRNYPGWPGHSHPARVRSLIAVPMKSGAETIGTLTIASLRPHTFTTADGELLQAFANHATLAVVNARLYEASQTAAATEERERLARDLHDSVTQTLFSASILAEAVPLQIARDREVGLSSIDKLRQLTRGALGEMRTLLLELRPTTLAEARLTLLLGYLADAAAARSHIRFHVVASGDAPELPPEVHIAFYRIAQEALSNVTRHSRATQATVELSDEPEGIGLTIWDNGRGFDTAAPMNGHMGLQIMRERAESVGARLAITSVAGQGTRLRLIWSEDEAERPPAEQTAE